MAERPARANAAVLVGLDFGAEGYAESLEELRLLAEIQADQHSRIGARGALRHRARRRQRTGRTQLSEAECS